MRPFSYAEPRTLTEAIALLTERKGEACEILAGGTDLLVAMGQRKLRPKSIINICKVAGLDHVRVDPGAGARIGALATIRALEKSAALVAKYPILEQAARFFGCIPIRNAATIGGNLARGNPTADLPPVLICLDARIHAVSPRGKRVIPVEELFVRPGVTALERDEILTEVEIPEPPADARSGYIKQCGRAVDLATVGVGVMLVYPEEPGQVCRDVRVAYAGAAPVPLRVTHAENALRGAPLTEKQLRAAAAEGAAQARPRADSWRAPPEYRTQLLRALTVRIISQTIGQPAERR
jgi:aerobic carbon-monoxide dehydrogenase medium subunit